MNVVLTSIVPAQYRGLARSFCQRAGLEFVAAERALYRGVLQPLLQRCIHRPGRNLRDGTLRDFEAYWHNQVPADFRIGFQADIEPRGRYGRVLELRLVETRLHDSDRASMEVGCTIVSDFLKVFAKGARPPKLSQLQRAVVSLHALGRHYQRCTDRSDAALMEDLRTLGTSALHDREAYPLDTAFRVTTPHGDWVGTTNKVSLEGKSRACFNVRTFLT